MVSHPETDSDSPIGSDRGRGRDTNLIIAYVLSTVDVSSLKNKLSSVNACHTADGSISQNAIGINLCIKT